MKYGVCVLASLMCLSACNKGPKVDLHNATGNEVAQAVKQSGIISGDTMVEPGLWQSKVAIQEMNIPGLPAEYAAKMKQTMAERSQETSRHCLTQADVKRPKADFFGSQDKSCKYQHFTMGDGKIDIQMACDREGSSMTMNMTGTYTPTSYAMDMSSTASGGSQQGMSMKMHIDSNRVGECTGKES